MNKRFLVLALFIIVAAVSRLIPHPYNFAPIGAMALFGAAYFADKKFAFILPLIAFFISDLLVNNILYADFYTGFVLFTPGFGWMYGAMALIVLTGFVILKKVSFSRVLGGALTASIIFFVVTNFGVWLGSPMYPQTFAGLIACFELAIPFFHTTILGDLVYSTFMFGGFEFAKKYLPELQSVKS